MSEKIYAGPVPEELDVRLEQRDTSPLPSGALLKFQVINRGKDPAHNYRWLLYEDGRWFLAWHSGQDSDWRQPFDTDLPAEPTKQLSAEVVNDVKARLRQANFMTQPPYQADQTVQDGSFYVVTARLDGRIHEVIYEALAPPPVPALEQVGSGQGRSESGGLASLVNKFLPWT